MKSDPILIYVTASDEAEAKHIADALLQKKLVACANIFPGMTAIFRWDNATKDAPECAMLLKTTREHYAEIQSEIIHLHSYTTPCILQISLDGGYANFLDWIDEETTPNSTD